MKATKTDAAALAHAQAETEAHDQVEAAHEAQAHDTTHTDEAEHETPEQAEAREAKRLAFVKGLLPVMQPQHQAAVILRANGVTLPAQVLDEVVECLADTAGAFELVLRRPVTVGGLTYERFIKGQGGYRRLTQLQGVRDAAQRPVTQLDATADGVRAHGAQGQGGPEG